MPWNTRSDHVYMNECITGMHRPKRADSPFENRDSSIMDLSSTFFLHTIHTCEPGAASALSPPPLLPLGVSAPPSASSFADSREESSVARRGPDDMPPGTTGCERLLSRPHVSLDIRSTPRPSPAHTAAAVVVARRKRVRRKRVRREQRREI
jgi:hypothetical protein